MTNKFLICLVVILFLILAGETSYLFKLKSDIREESKTNISSLFYNSKNGLLSHNFFGGIFFQKPLGLDLWNYESTLSKEFKEIENLHRDIDRIILQNFNRNFKELKISESSFYKPDVDIKDVGSKYIVKLDMPGFSKNEIRIDLNYNYLTITGERKRDISQKRNGEFFKRERSFGVFKRVIPVLGNLKSEEVTANYKNGVLTVEIPKGASNTNEKTITAL